VKEAEKHDFLGPMFIVDASRKSCHAEFCFSVSVLDVVSSGGKLFSLMRAKSVFLEEERTSSQSTHGNEPINFRERAREAMNRSRISFGKARKS